MNLTRDESLWIAYKLLSRASHSAKKPAAA